MVGAAIIAQAINFFGTLAVARLYGPVEVGIFGLYTAVFSIVVFAASWRYEVAIVTVDADREANDVALFVIGAGIASAITAALGLLAIEVLPNSIGLEASLRHALAALPISLLLASANLAGVNLETRNRRFRRVALQQIVTAVVTIGAQLAFERIPIPGSRLVAGFMFGQFAGTVVMARPLALAALEATGRPMKLARLRQVFGAHKAHLLYTVPFSLVTQFYFQMPVVALAALVGTREAGLFSIAFRTTFLPITLIPTAFAQVLFPSMARDRDRLHVWEPRLLAFLVGLGTLLIPAVALILVFGPDVYEMILGSQWRAAGILAQIIVVANLMNGLASGYDRIYFVLHRQHISLLIVCVISALSVAAMTLAYSMFRTAQWLVTAWMLPHLVLAFAWVAIIYWIAGFSIKSLVMRWVLIAAALASAAGALIAGKYIPAGDAWLFLVAASLAAIYGWILWWSLRPLKPLLFTRSPSR
ncbi:MAG TPA: oligosaccharide flippase family protein [Reyranella sp.]|nr:oligosaccharide flippase family protein [Reyranella sp.]